MRKWLAAVAIVAVAVLVIVVTGYREATATPVVVRYDITVPGWPVGQPPLRIVQLSDTHKSWPDMSASRLAAIVDQVNALATDLVVLTGDYHGGKLIDPTVTGNLDDAVRPFARLRSRLGTFAVRGNHDNAFWSPIVLPRYRMTYLQNRWADAGPVVIAGLDDLTMGSPDVGAALRGIPPGKPIILLMHEPDSFADVPPSVALTLAGHTHGGQIVLPWIGAPWIGSAFGRAHRRGLFIEGGRRLIVSSGLGTTAIPLRLGVPPEIVVVTLHR
jgi:predicted MPP superfamily phosphohydrolase